MNIWRWAPGNGAGAVARVTDSTWYDDFPVLSADGRRLAFASNRTSANELFVADPDGSNTRQITFHHGPLVVAPQWSPDGRRLAFSSDAEGNRDIYVIGVDGSRSERLTSDPSEEENPSWSRDGQWIYFRSDRMGLTRLWKVASSGGSVVQVTRGQASQGFESPDGKLLYFVRGVDVPGVWSVPVSGGEETLVVPGVREGFWGVADRGIAYIPDRMGHPDGTFEVRFFDFASKKVSTMLRHRAPNFPLMPGFAVSRSADAVLWAQIDRAEDDVMLIDPWVP